MINIFYGLLWPSSAIIAFSSHKVVVCLIPTCISLELHSTNMLCHLSQAAASRRILVCVLMAIWELVTRYNIGVVCSPFSGVLLCTWHHSNWAVTLSLSHSLVTTLFFTVSVFNIPNKMLVFSVLIPKMLRSFRFAFWPFYCTKHTTKSFLFTI